MQVALSVEYLLSDFDDIRKVEIVPANCTVINTVKFSIKSSTKINYRCMRLFFDVCLYHIIELLVPQN